MSGQNLYAALLGLRATPRPAHHYPCPRRGARWWGANPEPAKDGRAPPPPTLTPPGRR
jgi:hypothetical protein